MASGRLTLVAWTRIRTRPGPTVGASTLPGFKTSGPPNPSRTIAFTVPLSLPRAAACAPVVEPGRSTYYTAAQTGSLPGFSTKGLAVFETLKPLPPDAILGIMTLFRADPHGGKIDLSVGVYQDEQGRTPVLASVKRAEKAILEKQDSKTYVSIAGNAGFNRGVEELLYGKDHPALKAGRIATVQTPGGSGGLSIAGHLVARAKPNVKIYLSDPTWPNHQPLLKVAGMQLDTYPYYDYAKHRVDFEPMLERLEKASAGELVLIHGCCHNPCGADLSREQWQALTQLCERRGLVP